MVHIVVLVLFIEPGKFTYIVQDDTEECNVRGIFDPYGVASTYYSSGKLRYADSIIMYHSVTSIVSAFGKT